MAMLLTFVATISYLAAPLLLAALGGLLCEKSGVVNLALEGLMIAGAFSAAIVQVLLYPVLSGFSWVVAVSIGAICGMLLSWFFAYSVVTMHTDATVSGVGLNVVALGLSIVVVQLMFRQERTPTFLEGMPRDGLDFYPSVYLALFVFAAVFYFLYRTRTGKKLSACGEHPEAVEAAGLSVRSYRYLAILSSGLFAGLGGACLVLTQSIQYSRFTINGQGFIALSAVAFGQWRPERILLASLIFGTSAALAVYGSDVRWLAQLPGELFSMLPYLLNLVALIFFRRSGIAPQAIARPYYGR